MKKNKYPALTSIAILIINAIIVYFGRIHYPINFQPQTVSFFENYWVLTVGMCFISLILIIMFLVIRFFIIELMSEIKSLFNK